MPRDEKHRLLSADYSQIELRIIAGLSGEGDVAGSDPDGADVHIATEGERVLGVASEAVTAEMRDGKA